MVFSGLCLIHQAGTHVFRLLSRLFPLIHDFLHLHKLRLADNNWQGVLYTYSIRFLPSIRPVFGLCGAVQVYPGLFLISKYFVNLGVFYGFPTFPFNALAAHLVDQIGKTRAG